MFRSEEINLAACLQALEDGQDLESILKRYPKSAHKLRPRLQAASWLIQRGSRYDPPARVTIEQREKLLASLQAEVTPRRRTWRKAVVRLHFASLALQAGLLVLLCLGGLNLTFRIFQTAQMALPGELIYPIKLAQEQVRSFTIFDPAHKAEYQILLTQHRLLELQALLLESRYEDLPDSLLSYQWQLIETEQALVVLERHDRWMAQVLQQQLERTLQDQSVIFTLLVDRLPRGLRSGFEQALMFSSR